MITRFSYTSISTYENCPAQFKYSYIDNFEAPSSAAAMRGTRLHKMAEDFMRDNIQRIPHEIQKLGPAITILKTQNAIPEEAWMVDKDWKTTEDKSNARIKAVIDVHYRLGDVVYLKDYKSGQMYDDHRNQLELYGILALCRYPDAKRVDTSALYIDTGYEGMQGSIIRQMLPALKNTWEGKIIKIEQDDVFEPKPEKRKCDWCAFQKRKGGPCQY